MKFVQSGIAALGLVFAASNMAQAQTADEAVIKGLQEQKLGLAGQRLSVSKPFEGVVDVIEVSYSGMKGGNRTEICAKIYDLTQKRAIDQKEPDVVCVPVSVAAKGAAFAPRH